MPYFVFRKVSLNCIFKYCSVILVFFYKQLLNLILIDTAILKDFILNVSEFNSSVVLKLLIASESPGGLLKHKVYPQSS